MATEMLCDECQKKDLDTTWKGSCRADYFVPNNQLPDDHLPMTDSFQLMLCDPCAEHFNLCAWCLGSLDNGRGISVPTDKHFVRAFDKDDGGHIEGMYVGEQVLVQMVIDRFSGVTWDVKSMSRAVRFAGSRLRAVSEGDDNVGWLWGGVQYYWLEMYFDLNDADPKAKIELKETPMRSWRVVQNPKTWSTTVEIKH